MIAMQSIDPRTAGPPSLASPDGPPEQRPDVDAPAGAPTVQFEQLLARLEEGYEFHTMQLARLHEATDEPGRGVERSVEAASRQALTLIAAALRAMAEGRYGTCTSCGRSIPLERLEARPEARHCLRCRPTGIA